jgi:hypothetical protein
MFISIITAIIAGISIIIDDPEQSQKHDILVLITGIISTSYTKWAGDFNPQEIAGSHGDISNGYRRISIEIEQILSDDEIDRLDGVTTIRTISKQMLDLSTGGTQIPKHIWNKILDLYKKGELKAIVHDIENGLVPPALDTVKSSEKDDNESESSEGSVHTHTSGVSDPTIASDGSQETHNSASMNPSDTISSSPDEVHLNMTPLMGTTADGLSSPTDTYSQQDSTRRQLTGSQSNVSQLSGVPVQRKHTQVRFGLLNRSPHLSSRVRRSKKDTITNAEIELHLNRNC